LARPRALWLGKGKKQDEDRAARHGNSGELRVARSLAKAGYTLLTDLTVQHGGGTHQIDHVVRGQDRLFVIETKTWRGEIEGRAGGQTWTLHRPRRRGAITVYNPLFQNQTHADVINAMTGVPVTPLVVSAGFLTVPPELAARVLALPGLPAHLGPPRAPTGRIERAFRELTRRKAAWGQKTLAARHIRWMRASRHFDPVRALWVASAVCLVCAAFTEQRLLSG
jgi:Holliday junction resolvase-like predicted endonuclease